MDRRLLAAVALLATLAAPLPCLAEPATNEAAKESSKNLELKLAEDKDFREIGIKSIVHNKSNDSIELTTKDGKAVKFAIPDFLKKPFAKKGINPPDVPDVRPLPASAAH